MFADLRYDLHKLPPVAVVAVGGIPIEYNESSGNHELLGNLVTAEFVQGVLKRGLGLGAVLTYKNPKNKSLKELGDLCLKFEHQWTEYVLFLTLVFSEAPIAVRNAFAFDGRFHLSWVESEVNSETVTFTAAGPAKEWRKICKRSNDHSFKPIQREWFQKVDDLLVGQNGIFPL